MDKPEQIEGVCQHEWVKSVQMVRPADRTNRQIEMGMTYKGGRAAFKIRTCTRCKKVEYIDYKVEGLHERIP